MLEKLCILTATHKNAATIATDVNFIFALFYCVL